MQNIQSTKIKEYKNERVQKRRGLKLSHQSRLRKHFKVQFDKVLNSPRDNLLKPINIKSVI